MLVDLTIEVSVATRAKALQNEWMVAFGHLGTHFDVMNKQFPLENVELPGVVFDVSDVGNRDIDIEDIDISIIESRMFVALHTGFIERVEYGTDDYFRTHPQLSDRLIGNLVERHIAIIGIDFAGIRRGREHTHKDQFCADRGVFVVENLANLKGLLGEAKQRHFTAHTYPIKLADMSGLPCRVIGKL